ncbi:hypothetical protein B0H14DRAFT_3692846 [Mycena olivaceomarginata]|nr:hypothetical protein B0H14DRAFT_3692846 [Mycena olivaceomarginata]
MVRATHLAEHSRFVLVPRLSSIVANCIKHGDSIFTATEKIYRASTGAFRDRSYTEIAHQQLYLFLQLGGPAAAELAHRCLGLPSINATKRHIATVPLVASPKAPTMDEMLRNLDVGFPTPFAPPADGTLGPGFQIMVDEIKVEGRMRWDPRSNMILGLCREHSANYELEFLGLPQAESIHAGLASGKVHLASEATVAAVSSFSDVPVRNIAHPFIIAPTCKREAANGQKILLSAARDAVEKKAKQIGGRLYCISSDGDAKRRRAALALAFIMLLDPNGALFKKLGDLPLFDYHCGHNEITMDIDFKHLFKRFRNTLIRMTSSTIDGVVLTHQLIKAHLLRNSPHDARHINSLLNPNDRQNVKLIYSCSSEVCLPAFRNTRRVLRLLGALYRHVLEAREAGRFVPSQTYFDFMTAGKNAFFCVGKTQVDDPNGRFWLVALGTDPVELTFGKVRTSCDSNTDMFQLSGRLTAAVECENIFGEHPEWSRDTRVKNLSIKTTWIDGRGIAEGELAAADWEAPFESMGLSGDCLINGSRDAICI